LLYLCGLDRVTKEGHWVNFGIYAKFSREKF
jgi:hypothetical protein